MSLTVCFHLDLHGLNVSDSSDLNKVYQGGLKKLLKYLYAHQDFRLALSLPAPAIQHYSQKNPEAIDLFRDLLSRSQIEFLGGGYYSPIFPLLFPIDRTGQIEKMASLLRNVLGKRSRGLSFFGCIWEPSVIPSLESCGIEYILLDSELIPHPEFCFIPMVSSEQGKCVKILAEHRNLFPNPGESLDKWIERVEEKTRDSAPGEKCLCISGSMEQFLTLFDDKDFVSALCSSEKISLSTPMAFLESATNFEDVYVPAGMNPNLSELAVSPYEKKSGRGLFAPTVYDFFRTYQQDMQLYKRMMYVSLLITQSHGGDKMRKKAAQEKVWEAQAGESYIDLNTGFPSAPKNQQTAYRILNQAEQFIRDSKNFLESVTSFDYDNDGLKEFVCQMQNFNAVISLKGGMLTDLNVFPCGPNYAAGKFERSENVCCGSGFFRERLVELSDDEGRTCFGEGLDFSRLVFSKKKFDAKRKEIQMEVLGKFSAMALPVFLTKNYRVFSNGFTVQYILANRSPFPLRGTFVAELNLSQTDFSTESQYSIEVIQNENRNHLGNENFSADSAISLIQITDESEKRLFLVEPNESAGLLTENVSFDFRNESGEGFTARTRTVQFYWPVDLAAGLSMEKSLTMTLMPLKNKGKG